MKKPELAAPAGNRAMLNAVINAGADSVYFGVDDLNMRVQADNFSLENLPDVVSMCHEKGVRVHLTLNIILFESELSKTEELVVLAKQCGVDLVVCWDHAAIALCRKHGQAFCVSTQASVSNSIAAESYKQLGALRVVLARECTLEQIKEVKSKVDIEVEAFIHGAMCIAISGRCFMSQEVFGRSGNRGDCLQPCRREYEIYDKRKDVTLLLGSNYVMSSKDLSTINFFDLLIEAGIDAFKIEGRKRSPEYAAKTTSVYRRAIDLYFEGKLDSGAKSAFQAELNEIYNRGFTTGYYLTEPVGDSFAEHDGNASSTRKEFIGKVLNYYAKPKAAYIEIQANALSDQDRVFIIGETTGVVEAAVTGMKVNEADSPEAVKGDLVTFRCETRVRPNDKVYRIYRNDTIQKYK